MPPASPRFNSIEDFREKLGAAEYWRPHAVAALARHDLADGGALAMASGSTFPVLVGDQYVVKLFGFGPQWRRAFRTERRILHHLAEVEDIPAPTILADGQLFRDWNYLVLGKAPGRPWEQIVGELSIPASALGRRIAKLHALPITELLEPDHLAESDWVHALDQCTLPSRLTAQLAQFLAGWEDDDRVLVHGDLIGRHVYVEGDDISGIIDWGDARLFDRHYELAKLHLDMFGCEKRLLEAFLDAADWPDYSPRKALQMAFYRQAHCSAQHFTCDVFHRISHCIAIEEVATLEALAEAAFGL